MDPDLVTAGAALGALLTGVLGVKGVDRVRRRNSNNGTDRIVRAVEDVSTAVREEAKETRKVLHMVKEDTRVLLDRGGRDG